LGQETVARIDALGHVNKELHRLRFEGIVPGIGQELTLAGKSVGRVTSVCELSSREAIGLGYVRTSALQPGVQLVCDAGSATVIE
jgi:folate-binding Fe-S cluster repair protein YgfZ